MAASVTYDRDQIIAALRTLEQIVPSLARLGSVSDRQEAATLLSQFVDDWSVGPKLAQIRTCLSEPFEYDELEKLMADVPTWTLGARKPPRVE